MTWSDPAGGAEPPLPIMHSATTTTAPVVATDSGHRSRTMPTEIFMTFPR